MPRGVGNDESRFFLWLHAFGPGGLVLTAHLKRIWVYLYPKRRWRTDRHYNYLRYWVFRRKEGKPGLFKVQCRRLNTSFWDSIESRTSRLYYYISKHLSQIATGIQKAPQTKRCAYFFVVLRNTFTRCNKEEINQFYNPQNSDVNLNAATGRYQSLEELMERASLKQQATELYNWLLQFWPRNLLNVLCHMYEQMNAIPTSRLADESKDNIYQLHSRMRGRLKELATERRISEDVMRVFFHIYMPRMCQEVPVFSTYIIKRGMLR